LGFDDNSLHFFPQTSPPSPYLKIKEKKRSKEQSIGYINQNHYKRMTAYNMLDFGKILQLEEILLKFEEKMKTN